MMRAIDALIRNQRGSPAAEFALIAPIMLLLMLGLADLAFQGYVQAVLTGAVQKAGRDSTIQGNDTQSNAIDAKVQAALRPLVPQASFSSSRANYDNYAAIAGEPFTDSKYPNTSAGTFDGICNHGESYTDLNSNGRYDLDLSQAGQGGANEVTRYTVSITYNRLFPLGRWIGWGRQATLTATTILKNQPYATQTINNGTTTGTCP